VSFVGKLLRGDNRLPYTFWVIGVVGNAVIVAVDEIAYQVYGGNSYEDLYLLMAFVYFIFSLQRVWESAGRYTGPAIWARLARLVMLVGMVVVLANLMLYR
jgi:hypothetical protein